MENKLKYRAYNYSIRLVKFISQLPKKQIYWTISDQLLRSGTSVGANIVEAQAGYSKKDFTNYFSIALKSANETKYWLGILRDATEIENIDELNFLLTEIQEISNILGASILTLRSKKS